MTKNRTPTPVYLDPGMHPGLEVKGLKICITNSDRRRQSCLYHMCTYSTYYTNILVHIGVHHCSDIRVSDLFVFLYPQNVESD